MDQRFDFDENDSFLTRMRQRFDTYRVPIWQRPAFWGAVLMGIAGLFAVTLLISGLNSDEKSSASPEELPLISADGSDLMREAPADAGTMPSATEGNLFDAMQAGDTAPTEGALLPDGSAAPTGAPLTREQIEAAAAANAAQPAPTAGENLLAPKTDPLQGAAVDDMADGVMEKNGVKVIAENKINPDAVTAEPPVGELLPADGTVPAIPAPDATADATADLAAATADKLAAAPVKEAAKDAAKEPVIAPDSPVVETDEAAIPDAPVAAAGDRYIQLASIKEEAAAAGHWDKLKKQHGAIISGMAYRVVKADIPGKGTYYRIQAGPIAESTAKDTCATLNTQSAGSCLVVKP